MLTTEHAWTAATPAASSPATYELRLHGGTDDERLISIPPGKHSVGSGPRCSLRLQYQGVQPIECLIVSDRAGLRVRRWSDSTLVNGQPFDEASLAAGDVLTLGPVDLEVVAPQSELLAAESWKPDADIAGPTIDADQELAEATSPSVHDVDVDPPCDYEVEPQALQPAATNPDWDVPPSADEPPIADVSDEDLSTSADVDAASDGRTAIARQRHEHDELIARFNELERKVEQAMVAMQPEPGARDDLDDQAQHLESELAAVREQLAKRDGELAQARYAIDALERQLIDSHHIMHAFAEERLNWENQFNELESRLASYVDRIQELERQLDDVCDLRADDVPSQPVTSTDWAVEATASEAATNDVIDSEDVATAEETASDDSAAEDATWEEVVQESAPAVADQIDVETVAEPAEAAPAEQVAEVDPALDHLRGLSIWRQEPEAAAEDGDGDSTQIAADEADAPAGPEPTSFIDRYAHLFPADDAARAAPVEPPRPTVTETPSPEMHGEHGDEESVEQYMSKLLERMRGPATSGSEKCVESATEPAPAAPPDEAHETDEADASAARDSGLITDLDELKSKVSSPERASDRMAMRALANESARQAIGIHTARTLRRSAGTRFIVALLGASASLYLLLGAPGWQSLEFAAACVAAFAAIYWGKLTLSTLLQGIKLGAFEDHDEQVDPDKTLHPPLPIDVEH